MLGKPTIYFDCDQTLVMWGETQGFPAYTTKCIKFHLYGSYYWLKPHNQHIEALKKHKQDGFIIVVWSAAGQDWAEEVVNKLGLKDYVDHTLSKPDYYYDDKDPKDFMFPQRRVYYNYEE